MADEGLGLGFTGEGGIGVGPIVPAPPEAPTEPGLDGAGVPLPVPPPKKPQPPVEPQEPPEPTPEPTPEPQPPDNPGKIPVLPDASRAGGWLVLLGLIAIASALTDFFNWLFQRFLPPILNRKTPPSVSPTQLTQKLSNALGSFESQIDSELGVIFQNLAQQLAHIGQTIANGAHVDVQIARKVRTVERTLDHTAKRLASTGSELTTTRKHLGQVENTVEANQRQTRTQFHTIEQQNEAQIHHVTTLIEPELEQLRKRVHHLERGATTTWDEIRKHDEALGVGAITAATAIALGRLGGSWVECEGAKALGRGACQIGPNGINDLLGLLTAGFVIADLRTLVKEAQKVEHGVAVGLGAILNI